MSSKDDPSGAFGKSYIDDGEPGIHPPFVFVKNALGHTEKQASLSTKWLLNFDWLDFYPEDNLRDVRLQYLNQDLVMLLRLKHHVFWSQIMFDMTFAKFLDSFLLYARRVGTTRSTSPLGDGVVGAEPSADPALLSPSHKTLMRNVFAVVVRMSTAKESPTIGFGSAQAHGDLIFNVLDFPRLFDFVSLYARFNFPLVSNVVSHLFSIEPKYDMGLAKGVAASSQVMREMSRQLSHCLQLALNSPAPTDTNVSAATTPSLGDANHILTMRSTCEDVATYLIDLVFSFSTFCKVYPDTATHFEDCDTVAMLSYVLRALLPNLKLVFDQQQLSSQQPTSSSLDILRRHFASRNHSLSIINKTITSVIAEIHQNLNANESADVQSRAPLPASVFRARLPKIQKLLSSISSMVLSLTMPDRQLVERVSKSSEDHRPLAWLLLEDDLQQSYAGSKTASAGLTSSTGLTQTVVNPETFVIVRDLESKYSLLSKLEGMQEHLLAAADEEKEQVSNDLSALEAVLSEIRVILEKVSATASTYSSSSAYRQMEMKWQEALRRSAEVKAIFPDLNDGFIVYALLEHYKSDPERMVHDMLEHNLPPSLSKVNHKLSLEDARKLVFDTLDSLNAAKKAAAEDEERFSMDFSKGVTTIGKPKVPGTVRYQDALKVADSSAVAKATLKFVERQDKEEEERTYAVQLKRARGEKVDEDDEELYEQLRASAEIRERAERGGLTYDDEPDDSLDYFHPAGTLADDSQDNLLAKSKRGPLRSKFSNAPVHSISAATNSSAAASASKAGAKSAFGAARGRVAPDEEEDEEDEIAQMQADFAADDAALLPFAASSTAHPGAHHGGGGGAKQTGGGGAGRGQDRRQQGGGSSGSGNKAGGSAGGRDGNKGRGSGGGGGGNKGGDRNQPKQHAPAAASSSQSHGSSQPQQPQSAGRGKRTGGGTGGGGGQQSGGGRGKPQHSRGK